MLAHDFVPVLHFGPLCICVLTLRQASLMLFLAASWYVKRTSHLGPTASFPNSPPTSVAGVLRLLEARMSDGGGVLAS